MRRSQVACTEAESWRDSVAHPSKVSPGLLECGQRNVLCEDIGGANLTDNAGHFGPQVARICGAEALPSSAPWLTRETTTHHVDPAAPGGAVEGAHVLEYGERWQATVGLSRCEHLAAVGVNLDGADWDVPEQDAAEDAAACASE